MDATDDEQRVSRPADEPVRAELKGQLALEDAERLVEGVVVKRRSGPAGPDEILDDADRPTCLVGGESNAGSDQRNGGTPSESGFTLRGIRFTRTSTRGDGRRERAGDLTMAPPLG